MALEPARAAKLPVLEQKMQDALVAAREAALGQDAKGSGSGTTTPVAANSDNAPPEGSEEVRCCMYTPVAPAIYLRSPESEHLRST